MIVFWKEFIDLRNRIDYLQIIINKELRVNL